MINKIKDIPDGTGVWVKMYRKKYQYDSKRCIRFVVGHGWQPLYLNDENEILTEEQMRERFSGNDGLPKQGDIIHVRDYEWYWDKRIFVSFYKWKVVTDDEFNSVNIWDEWRPSQKKTELTLAEVEEKLGLEKGSLIIKD